MKFFFLILLLALSLPGFSQEDDEAFIENAEKDRRNQVEAALKIEEARQNTTEVVATIPDELKKLGVETINAAALMDERVVKVLIKMMKESGQRKSSPELVRSMILEKAKGSGAERFLRRNPRVLNCLVDIIRDEKAMSSAIGLFLRKGDLKLYFFIWIGFLVLGWILKKIIINEEWDRSKRIFAGIAVSLLMSAISVYTFYKIFESELSPAVAIISRHISGNL